ncbi:MAG: hypothetical protein JSW66_02630 [Phycisphaerales bacterium]|nr:MAG: hypothetical protein JSW66_02630 [Phycisphaerales bacterium]
MKNRLSENSFDEMLGRALRASSEPVPADFTPKTIRQIRQAEQRRILARVVLQERLALAGCIALLAAAALVPMLLTDALAGVLQGTAAGFTDQGRVFVDKIPQTLQALLARWQLCAVMAAVIGLAGYSLADLLVGDRLRMG